MSSWNKGYNHSNTYEEALDTSCTKKLYRLGDLSPAMYNMSFTAGGLLHKEASKIAQLYQKLQNWDLVKQEALQSNTLQARTASSSVRVLREVTNRLKCLTPPQLELLANGSNQEQGLLLWIAACKRHQFIREFATEVLREKYLRLDFRLTQEDYIRFFNSKAEWDERLDALSDSTQKKIQQVNLQNATRGKPNQRR